MQKLPPSDEDITEPVWLRLRLPWYAPDQVAAGLAAALVGVIILAVVVAAVFGR